MADLVKFGPFTVYKSPAYEEAVRQQQLDVVSERESKRLQQELLRANLEKAAREEAYLKSPEGQAALLAEREKTTLGIERLKSEIASEAEKQKKAAPEYAPLEAARLRGLESTLEQNLATQNELVTSAGERVKNLQSASATLPAEVAGPVMQKDMATQMMRPALELEADMRNRIIGTEAARAATSKQLGELTGTLPVPEGLGGGTVPATANIGSIYQQRLEQLVPMKAKAISYINSFPEGSPERMAAEQTIGKISGYEDAQTKKIAQNALKIPGLEGMASSEKSANEVRGLVPNFVSSVGGIDELIKLGNEVQTKSNFDRPRLMARADAIRTALAGQMRIAIGGPGTMTQEDRDVLMTAIANPTAMINIFTQDRLGELKKVLARKFVADARANGFGVKSVQSVLDANSDPEDINSFGIRKNIAPEMAKDMVNKQQNFASEAEARAAGFGDGDSVMIQGKSGTLTP
jgi:hypothetical protein